MVKRDPIDAPVVVVSPLEPLGRRDPSLPLVPSAAGSRLTRPNLIEAAFRSAPAGVLSLKVSADTLLSARRNCAEVCVRRRPRVEGVGGWGAQAATDGQAGVQLQGRRSSSWRAGWSGRRARTSASQACGSTPLS